MHLAVSFSAPQGQATQFPIFIDSFHTPRSSTTSIAKVIPRLPIKRLERNSCGAELPLHLTFQVSQHLAFCTLSILSSNPRFLQPPGSESPHGDFAPSFLLWLPKSLPSLKVLLYLLPHEDSLAHCRPQEHLPSKSSGLFKHGVWLPPFVLRK